MSCKHRRNKNVLSCRDLAIGDIMELSIIKCTSSGTAACQSSATFKVETWNTLDKTVTYLWEVKIGSGATGINSVLINDSADMDTVEIWVHSAINIPIDVTCTVSDGTHTDTMTIEYISENE